MDKYRSTCHSNRPSVPERTNVFCTTYAMTGSNNKARLRHHPGAQTVASNAVFGMYANECLSVATRIVFDNGGNNVQPRATAVGRQSAYR